jgi:hypothetical protein
LFVAQASESQQDSGLLMRRFLVAFVTATVIGACALAAAHPLNHGTPSLNKQQKQQRKAAKREQHAAKKAMSRNKLSRAERRRFKHDQATERRVIRAEQKNESRNLKQSRKSAKRSHPTV